MGKRTKKQMNNGKKNTTNGITLIALVVTIVLLIILATISVQVVLGENGLITRANKIKVVQAHASVKEAMQFEYAEYNIDKFQEETPKTFIEYLKGKEIIGEADGEGKYTVNVKKLLNSNPQVGVGKDGKDEYKLETSEENSYILKYYGKTESENIEIGTLKDTTSGKTEKKEMITFRVKHADIHELSDSSYCIVEYQCEKGMTWEQFVNSEYNSESFTKIIENKDVPYRFKAFSISEGDGQILGRYSGSEFNLQGSKVYKGNVIEPSQEYDDICPAEEETEKDMIRFKVKHTVSRDTEYTDYAIVEYQCERGMSWGEFIRSKYNDKRLIVSSEVHGSIELDSCIRFC